MNQILDIFRKDARHHWIEIAVFLLLLSVYVWNEPSQWGHNEYITDRFRSFLTGSLNGAVILAEWLLMVRVVQGESLVGDRQFWITRPYDWKKLLAAKGLFAAVFIQLPLLLAGIVLVTLARFPSPLSFAPGILAGQTLMSAALVLPVIALAVVTPNIGQLFLGLLLVVAYTVGGVILASYIPGTGFSSDVSGVQFLVVILGSVAAILYQYARRKTLSSRLLLVGVALTVLALLAFSPYRWLANHEYPAVENGQLPLQLTFNPEKPKAGASYKRDEVILTIPIKFSNLPAGTVASVDGSMLTVEPVGQSSWSSGWKSNYQRLMPDRSEFDLNFELNRSYFRKIKSQAVKARIAFALTLFHDKETKRVLATNGEFSVPEIGICSIDGRSGASNLTCRYALKSPAFVATLVSSESTCSEPKHKKDSVAPPITLYNFNRAEDDPGPLSPVNTFSLYFGQWEARDDGRQFSPTVCPGTPFTLAIQEEAKKAQTEIVIDTIRLEDYALPDSYGAATGYAIDIH